jgi:hypothetical protein
LYSRDFPEEELHSLEATYGSFFNILALKSELTVVYASAELKSKPVFAMIKKIVELYLQTCFPEVYRLSTYPDNAKYVGSEIVFSVQAH